MLAYGARSAFGQPGLFPCRLALAPYLVRWHYGASSERAADAMLASWNASRVHPQQAHRPGRPSDRPSGYTRVALSRTAIMLQFAIVAASLLAIPTMYLPWDEWTNAAMNVSGTHTAGVEKWGPLATSNIPVIAAVVGVIAATATWRRNIWPLIRVSGYVSAAGGLWIGIVTALAVYRFPTEVHYQAGIGIYVASAMAFAMVMLGTTVVVTTR